MTGSNSYFVAPKQRGFSLFIAVILSAVAATVTLSLTTLAYKSLLLSSSARESQFAFYTADTALECALYYDSIGMFPYSTTPSPVTIHCPPGGPNIILNGTWDGSHTTTYTIPGVWYTENGSDCASITVYKTDGVPGYTGKVFSDGVNVSCANVATDPRAVERGLKATY